jgi:hypothetical protein
MTTPQKIAVITFGVFMSEAIIHYNIGANGHKKDKKFVLPPMKDLAHLTMACGVFVLINGLLIHLATSK